MSDPGGWELPTDGGMEPDRIVGTFFLWSVQLGQWELPWRNSPHDGGVECPAWLHDLGCMLQNANVLSEQDRGGPTTVALEMNMRAIRDNQRALIGAYRLGGLPAAKRLLAQLVGETRCQHGLTRIEVLDGW
jgi:hypothetical protein